MITLQRIQEIEQKLAQLKAQLQAESQAEQWEPIGGSWIVHSDGEVGNIGDYSIPGGYRLFGARRSTKEQALQARENMRGFNRLLAYRDEFDPDFVEVWNGRTANYFVCYNINTSEYGMDGNSIYKGVGVVYMSQEVATELARKLNSGEVVL